MLTLRPIGPHPPPRWQLVHILRTSLRRTDLVGVLTDDTLAGLLPATTEHDGSSAARRVLRRARAERIELELRVHSPDFARAEPETIDLPGERRRGFRLWRACPSPGQVAASDEAALAALKSRPVHIAFAARERARRA